MYIDVTSPAKPIPIGVVGENLSRVVVWDIGRWIADYGEGYAMLMAKRPVDEAPYPVPLVQSGNQALWRVRDVDLFAAGEGECQLSYAAGGQVKNLLKDETCGHILSKYGITGKKNPQTGNRY